MSDSLESNFPLPQWVGKIKSSLFRNKKPAGSEFTQPKEPEFETKLIDASNLKEDIARFLTSDHAQTLSLNGANSETSGLIRFIIFDGKDKSRVGIFATTRFWFDLKDDRAVFG